MIFHENRLLGRRFSWNITPYLLFLKKAAKFEIAVCLLQLIGGALRVRSCWQIWSPLRNQIGLIFHVNSLLINVGAYFLQNSRKVYHKNCCLHLLQLWLRQSDAFWVILHAFLSSVDLFQNQLFREIFSLECQTVWILIRPDVLSGKLSAKIISGKQLKGLKYLCQGQADRHFMVSREETILWKGGVHVETFTHKLHGADKTEFQTLMPVLKTI